MSGLELERDSTVGFLQSARATSLNQVLILVVVNVEIIEHVDCTTAISTNGYATLGTSTNAGKLVPAASAPTTTGAWYFTIEGSGKFTQGAYASFDYVDVKVHRVHTVAG